MCLKLRYRIYHSYFVIFWEITRTFVMFVAPLIVLFRGCSGYVIIQNNHSTVDIFVVNLVQAAQLSKMLFVPLSRGNLSAVSNEVYWIGKYREVHLDLCPFSKLVLIVGGTLAYEHKIRVQFLMKSNMICECNEVNPCEAVHFNFKIKNLWNFQDLGTIKIFKFLGTKSLKDSYKGRIEILKFWNL